MAENDAPAAWHSLSFSTTATEFPIRLVSVKRPAALAGTASSTLNLLSNLKPPEPAGAGVHAWGARVCYWSPGQLEQLQKFEVPPTLVYKFGGMPGPTDAKQWSMLLRLLREQQSEHQQAQKQQHEGDQAEEMQQQEKASADDASAAATPFVDPRHGVATQLDGQFCNVLLLHVAGRFNDHSIKLLLVPKLDPEALTSKPSERVMLWAYFSVLAPFTIEQRILMEQHHHLAPLTLDVVKTSLKFSRSQQKQWQSCVEYHVSNQPRDDGLPVWMCNVSCNRCHLSQASPRGQLDLVDRSFVDKHDDDRATAAAADASSGQACDSCACGYAAAGAENLKLAPLRCGPAGQFELPCSCPPEWWCGNALRRRQLLQLWKREQLPPLKIQRCGAGKGFGLFVADDLPAGTAIGEYCGEVLTQLEVDKREELYQQAGLHYVWQEIGLKSQPPEVAIAREQARQEQRAAGNKRKRKEDKDKDKDKEALVAVDATWMGGITRFINHSCEPNCQAVTVCNSKGTFGIDGKPMMITLMETTRDIKKNEELTFDYCPVDDETWDKLAKQQQRSSQSRGRAAKQAAEPKSPDDRPVVKFQGRVPCQCGAAKCRGVIFWEKAQNGVPIIAAPS